MTFANILATLLFATAAGCPADSGSAPGPTSEVREAGAAGSVQLTGFVELYPDAGVQLLSGGRELTLVGAAHMAEPMGGLEVVVKGRFIDRDVFWVESVGPRAPQVMARTGSGKRPADRTARQR